MAPNSKTRIFVLLLYLSGTGNTTSTSASTQVLHSLSRRQSTCPASNPISCAAVDPKLPSNFCCASGTTCISMDSSSSALCCPSGGPCTSIQPINCDVALQNANSASSGPIFTSRLNDQLPVCGNACCPFGYTCSQRQDGSSFCSLNTAKAITTPVSSSAPSATKGTATSNPPTTSASATTPTASTSQPSGIDSTTPTPSAKSNSFPPGVFLAGFFPGILVGALGVLAWVILTGRHKKQRNKDSDLRSNPSMYGKRPSISDPLGDPSTRRSDFVRRTKTIGKSAKSMFGRKEAPDGTPGLPFDDADNSWRNLTPPENNDIPQNALGQLNPVGRYTQMQQSQQMQPGLQRSLTYGSESTTGGPGADDYPQSAGYSASAGTPGYPVTPDRNTQYTENDNAINEIIKIYTPPNQIDMPPAAVAPLRGMNSQRRSRDSGYGDGSNYNAMPQSGGRAPYPTTTDDEKSMYEPSNYETLTPARYEGGGLPKRPRKEGGTQGRPETTFTEMLRQINFPDPMKQGNAPAMPAIPKEFR